MEPPDWDAVIRPHVEGRRVILAGGPVAAWTERVRELRRLGSGDVFVLGVGSVGTGPLPGADECEWHVVDVPGAPSAIERIRMGNAVLADPPPDVLVRLDAFDPDGTALVLGDFLNTAARLGGRPFLAHRHAEWVALEDKVAIDAFWDRVGVSRAPAEVVPVTVEAVTAAVRRVGRGDGVVMAGDARDGWHGGASLVRWADSPALVGSAVSSLGRSCDSVRVMPYLHGIPCSVHGIVLPDGVAVIRPVEMVVSRKPDGTFFYAGCATFYDPSPTVRDEMRTAARRVGEALRAEVGFRGAFTMDGIATVDGFRPTELNPRNGAGLTVIARGTGMPVQLLLDLIVAGRPIGCSAADLEAALLTAADTQRTGGTWSGVHGVEREATTSAIVIDTDRSHGDSAGAVREAADGETADATMTVGPAQGGTFVRTVFEPSRTPIGPSVGTRAVAVWTYADRRFGLGIGPLTPAGEAGGA